MEAVVQIFERAYFARDYGRLNDEEWSRFRRSMCDPRYHEAWVRAGVNSNLILARVLAVRVRV
jgi:hypothetical protein